MKQVFLVESADDADCCRWGKDKTLTMIEVVSSISGPPHDCSEHFDLQSASICGICGLFNKFPKRRQPLYLMRFRSFTKSKLCDAGFIELPEASRHHAIVLRLGGIRER
jgi:hypothetical protein